MRYQIADGIIDYTHICWVTFLLAPLGTFTMGNATIFGPLRDVGPFGTFAALQAVLVFVALLALARSRPRLYATARLGSACWYGYLFYLCASARPISTGVIYATLAVGALALAFAATRRRRV